MPYLPTISSPTSYHSDSFLESAQQPWNRLHLDFAGPFLGNTFLVLVDAYSKWLDVIVMKSITTTATVDQLRLIFSTHGLPKTLVTDNGRSFTSNEFHRFCHANGIHHITSPYHPSTNGLAERAVQSFKQGLKRMQGESLVLKLARYLFCYCITPHSTTGLFPAELLKGRHPRSVLDLVHPDPVQRVESRQQQQLVGRGIRPVRQFQVSDKIFVWDFQGPGVRWMLEKLSG